ncbi:MAG: response regulator [Burkholderiales bacterium]|nr:response regulator [Burkholderiales bacterium]
MRNANGSKVLVVDDCHDSADSMCWILSTYGYQVETAYDGLTAIGKARLQRPDVVLLDLALPELDGYQVAKALRDQLAPHAPILVAVTGYGREHDKQRSAAAGFSHHLLKPVDPAALLDTLAKVLRPAREDSRALLPTP